MSYCTILTTLPSKKEGIKLLRLLLKKKQVACGNLISGVESHYWWQGKIDSAREILLLLKTKTSFAEAVIKMIRQNHSYTIPEVIVLPILSGNPSYLKWISDSLQ